MSYSCHVSTIVRFVEVNRGWSIICMLKLAKINTIVVDGACQIGSAMGPNKSVGSEASLESSGRSRSARKQSARAKEDAEEHCADGDSQRSHEMAIKWRDTKELDDELFQRYYEFVHVGNGRFSKVYCVKRRDGTSTSWRALKKIFHSSATDGESSCHSRA